MGAKVDLGRNEDGGFKLAVTLEVSLLHPPRNEAQILVDKAERVCRP